MDELPVGTATLLLTDIAGSTRLLHRLGDDYTEVLAEHRRLLRAAVRTRGGHEVSAQGDSFFAVFERAVDAAAAAAEAQRALHEQSWPKGGAVCVRMGLHTGQVTQSENDYAGLTVHHAARLMAAGHGGQTLVSRTTRDAIEGSLPNGVCLRSLGRHRLKDITQPEHIYQLIVTGLPEDFPPLQTIDLRPNNLPAPVTEIIGRKEEAAAATELLRGSSVRLLTLTGVGGTGKTRLSLRVALDLLGDFEDGVFFVELAAVSNPALVIPTIAQTLGVREVAGQSLPDTLQEHLKEKQLLLVLDNFEKLMEAATAVAGLLAACRDLKVLATSRIPLHLRGEYELPVPPLALPDLHDLPPVTALSQIAAIELFIQRAQAVQADFNFDAVNAAPIAEVCARLDGLPLAIELVAPRLRRLPPKVLLTSLENRLRMLTGGARDLPERHQTLRECIAWSYDLLEESERALFRQLAVFAGGCTLEAVQAVIRSETATVSHGLASLVDKNLLQQRPADGSLRYSMLETIREFSGERLEASDEAKLWQGRHTEFFLSLAEQAETQLGGVMQNEWLHQLDAEQDNLRAALSWSLENEPETALRLAGVLWRFWEIRGQIAEGRRWLREVLRRNEAAPNILRSPALCGAGQMAYSAGEFAEAAELFRESLQAGRAAGDNHSIAAALLYAGLLAPHQGDYERAETLLDEAVVLLREFNDRPRTALALLHLSHSVINRLDFTRAQELLEESYAITRELGDDNGAVLTTFYLGDAAMVSGNWARAGGFFEESLHLAEQCGHKIGAAFAHWGMSHVAREAHDFPAAHLHLRQALLQLKEINHGWALIFVLESGALLAAAQELPERSARLMGAAESWRKAISSPRPPAYNALYERYLHEARQSIGKAAFKAAWSQGCALSQNQALQYASNEIDVPPAE